MMSCIIHGEEGLLAEARSGTEKRQNPPSGAVRSRMVEGAVRLLATKGVEGTRSPRSSPRPTRLGARCITTFPAENLSCCMLPSIWPAIALWR
jgi:hypothetical protein